MESAKRREADMSKRWFEATKQALDHQKTAWEVSQSDAVAANAEEKSAHLNGLGAPTFTHAKIEFGDHF